MDRAKFVKNLRYMKFIIDMENAGIQVFNYRGRNFYDGPAVTVSDINDAMRETRIPCQWDNMGLEFVVYPK